jgi:assimilatory nitrate reductase catalytic subunit
LERAELVIVQEAFSTTATCAYADLLLPATTWGEKEGTVTNSERRISRVRSSVPAPAQTRHDWQIAVDFAQALAPRLGKPAALFDYPTPESVWNEHRESTRNRDLDITGMSYDLLESQGPQQWPMLEGAAQGKLRLYEDGVFPTPDGRARFVATPYKPVAEPREARYPFSLTTGRLRDQWHGMSRTGTLGRLFGHVPEPSLQMHRQDMERRLLKEGDLVQVSSRRASIVVPVQASAELGLSQVFMAMHWGQEFISGTSATGAPLAGVNALTTSAYCPDSKQPEFKHAAVKVLKAELPWSLVAVAWLDADRVLCAQSALRKCMGNFAYASCVPFARTTAFHGERSGLVFAAAHHEPVPAEVLLQIEKLLTLDDPHTVRYADPKQGQHRAALMRHGASEGTATLNAYLLAGDTSAHVWMQTLLMDALPAQRYGRALLLPSATPPIPVVSRGKAVCTCFDVSDAAITTQLAQCTGSAPERLQSLQQSLKCGTNCGSCLPQLQRMVRASLTQVHAPLP